MNENVCNDNRFNLIAKYKAKLIEATNIETSQDEMAVIDNILFRMWQMGWLDKLDAASPWHRVEEPPKEHMWCFVYTDEPEMIMPIRIAFYVASCTGKGNWYHYESGEDIDDEVDYWAPMYLEGPDIDKDLPWPIEPPKEDEHGN
jgi:hypothetical protein